jgi:1-acyl-sn-glycerol-3-phosphate acyltransferase
MKLKRKNWILDASYPIWNTYFSIIKNVTYEGEEHIPKVGPALVVPKHQSYYDIPLEGILLQNNGRYGNWIMKGSLPSVLDYWGGIRVARPIDIHSRSRDERRKYMEHIRDQNKHAQEYVSWLFS